MPRLSGDLVSVIGVPGARLEPGALSVSTQTVRLPCLFGIIHFRRTGAVWTFGAMIWSDAPRASLVALALLPVELAFWIGFALSFGPPLGIARTVLVLLP